MVTKIAFIGSIFTLFLIDDIKYITISVLILIIVQLGFVKNNDYCWYTKMVNELIDPNKPNRKWRSDWESFIRHYVRGDEWAYSNRFNNGATTEMTVVNVVYILIFIKLVIKNNLFC